MERWNFIRGGLWFALQKRWYINFVGRPYMQMARVEEGGEGYVCGLLISLPLAVGRFGRSAWLDFTQQQFPFYWYCLPTMCERENHHRATTTTRAVVRCGAEVERVERGRKATLGVTLFLRKFVKYAKHAAMHAKWQAKPGNQTTHQPFPAPFSHFPHFLLYFPTSGIHESHPTRQTQPSWANQPWHCVRRARCSYLWHK